MGSTIMEVSLKYAYIGDEALHEFLLGHPSESGSETSGIGMGYTS